MLKSFRQGMSAPALDHTLSSPADIDNLQLYIDAQEFGNITFAAGSGDGDPIASVAGVDDALGVYDESNGTAFLYEATGAQGKPAFKKGDDKSIFRDENAGSPRLYGSDEENGQATIVYFFTGIFNGTADTGYLFSFMNTVAAIEILSDTSIQYYADESLSGVPITGTYNLSSLTMVAVTMTSDSSASVKINDQALQTLDPHNNWNNNGSVRLGTSAPTFNGVYHELYGAMVYDRALSAAELDQLYTWGVARYG